MKYSQQFLTYWLAPLKDFLLRGASPHQLSMAIAAGLVIGVFPILGTTTLFCTAVALAFRWNLAAVQLANYSIYPLQFLLLIPFIKTGEYLFGIKPLSYSLEEVTAMMGEAPLRTLAEIGEALLVAALTWALLALPVFYLLHLLLKRLLMKMSISNKTEEVSEQ